MHPIERVRFYSGFANFFVFLNALERFTLTDWGLNPGLDGRVKQAHEEGLINNEHGRTYEPKDWMIVIDGHPITLGRKKLDSALAMTGRGALTVEGFAIDGQGQERTLAIKMYWPRAHRPAENIFIYDALVAVKGNPDILNHLPTVFASQESHSRE